MVLGISHLLGGILSQVTDSIMQMNEEEKELGTERNMAPSRDTSSTRHEPEEPEIDEANGQHDGADDYDQEDEDMDQFISFQIFLTMNLRDFQKHLPYYPFFDFQDAEDVTFLVQTRVTKGRKKPPTTKTTSTLVDADSKQDMEVD